MNPRLLILIAVAAAMAIYFAAVKGRAKPVDLPLDTTVIEADRERVKIVKKTLDKLVLPGSEPPEEPELSVQVEVDRSRGKNRLYFTISEAHGYYVEQFQVQFWYVKPGGPGRDDFAPTQFFDRHLPAKDTLRVCMEVVPAELANVGGDIGETGNWDAEIVWHGRARAKNPDSMPLRTDIGTCD